MQSSSFRSRIFDKTPRLFTKKLTQSEMGFFLFIAGKFKGGSSSCTRDFTKWRKIVLPKENVAQASSKRNKYQVIFI